MQRTSPASRLPRGPWAQVRRFLLLRESRGALFVFRSGLPRLRHLRWRKLCLRPDTRAAIPSGGPPAPWVVHNDGDIRRARPELHQLVVFLRVAEERSFSAAARQLGCSQPAVSQTIRRLEDIYGGDLFARRRGAPLALTPIGRAVLPGVRRILDECDRQIADATYAAQGRSGALSVGFCSGLFEGRFRVGLTTFVAEAPRVRLRLMEGTPDMLCAALGQQRIDMMVSLMPSVPNDTDHESEFLWKERLVAVIQEKSPLACREKILPSALGAGTLCWPCVRHDKPHHEVLPTTILELVTMGVETGIMPVSAAIPRLGIVVRPIDDDNAHVAVHASWVCADANPLRHRLLHHLRAAAKTDCGIAIG